MTHSHDTSTPAVEPPFGAGFEAAFRTVVESEGPYKGWTPADDPAEIVTDLFNEVVDLREMLAAVVSEVDDLVDESSGVYGLHLNGEPAPWSEILAGGFYERLNSIEIARDRLGDHKRALQADVDELGGD